MALVGNNLASYQFVLPESAKLVFWFSNQLLYKVRWL